MLYLPSFIAAGFMISLPFTSALPHPLPKRIAQVISDSTQPWMQACIAAGGADQCNPLSVTAFSTLLAAAGPCDQQNAADQMIDLAKTLNNDPTMIKLTQIFAQQARNSPNSLSVLYCGQAPANEELNGLFQCQFQGVNTQLFTGNVAVGQPGTIPFGQSSPLSPAGSCPAHPSGPIAAGSQLVSLTQDPGVSSTGSSSPPSGNVSSSSGNSSSNSAPASVSSSADTTSSTPSSSSSGNNSSSTSGTSSVSSSGDFHLQNGQDAQKLNAQFASLTASSSCNDGDQACVSGGFAQCVSGKFAITPCAGGTQCFALPLVNKAGTSITCDTASDAQSRIAATGASGGITGDSSTPSSSTPASSSSSTPDPSGTADMAASISSDSADASSSETPSAAGDFHKQNGLDAQALNKKFSSLTASSSCTNDENACVGGGFAQCVDGSFQTTPCAGGTQCFALPLVNKAGTSITCDTQADAEARITASGVSGGLTG